MCDGACPGVSNTVQAPRSVSISTPSTSGRSGSITRAIPDAIPRARSAYCCEHPFRHPALTPDLEPARERELRIGSGRKTMPVVGVHPELASGPVANRRGLPPVVDMRMGAREQPHPVHAESHLGERPLEIGHRPGLVHAGIDKHHAVPGRDRPRIAVRHPRERQRQPQPPQPRDHPLAAAELTSAWHARARYSARHLDSALVMSSGEVATRYFGAQLARAADAPT